MPVQAVVRDGHPRQCKAKTRSGARCRSFAIEGGAVCRMHGGASPKVRAAAERRKAELAATALLDVIWDPDAKPVTDPFEALRSLAGRLQHAADVLGGRLEGADLDGSTALAFARMLRELRLALDGMARLNLEERHVQLESERAQMVIVSLNRALDSLMLTAFDRARVVEQFVGGLRIVQDGDEPQVTAMVRATERTMVEGGEQVAHVVLEVLGRLELSDEQKVLARQVVPEEMRRLAGQQLAVVRGQVES